MPDWHTGLANVKIFPPVNLETTAPIIAKNTILAAVSGNKFAVPGSEKAGKEEKW